MTTRKIILTALVFCLTFVYGKDFSFNKSSSGKNILLNNISINTQTEAFLYFDCKDIAAANNDNEINPQNSVQPLRPKLLINKGAITVIKPPERSG